MRDENEDAYEAVLLTRLGVLDEKTGTLVVVAESEDRKLWARILAEVLATEAAK